MSYDINDTQAKGRLKELVEPIYGVGDVVEVYNDYVGDSETRIGEITAAFEGTPICSYVIHIAGIPSSILSTTESRIKGYADEDQVPIRIINKLKRELA